MKYPQKYWKQGNLEIYFFNYEILSINKTIKKWAKAVSFPSPRKVTLESLYN